MTPAFQTAEFRWNSILIPNGKMLHKTGTQLQNFVAKGEALRLRSWIGTRDSMFERDVVSSCIRRPISERQPPAVHNWAHRPGWRVPWNLPRSHSPQTPRDLTTSELETATGLLDENWTKTTFNFYKTHPSSAALHLSPVSPVSFCRKASHSRQLGTASAGRDDRLDSFDQSPCDSRLAAQHLGAASFRPIRSLALVPFSSNRGKQDGGVGATPAQPG